MGRSVVRRIRIDEEIIKMKTRDGEIGLEIGFKGIKTSGVGIGEDHVK
jgi:hypothetical protein